MEIVVCDTEIVVCGMERGLSDTSAVGGIMENGLIHNAFRKNAQNETVWRPKLG
jgi:hypothetical protein